MSGAEVRAETGEVAAENKVWKLGDVEGEDTESLLERILMALVAKGRDKAQGHLWACSRLRDLMTTSAQAQREVSDFRRMGGFRALSRLLEAEDEDVVEAAASTLSDLSMPSTRKPQQRCVQFGARSVVYQELEFSESGTGFHVWTAAIVLGRWLEAHTESVCGVRVLELGSGMGVCGILAALLGGHVTMSDYIPAILDNLMETARINGVSARVVRLDWVREGNCMESSGGGWYAGDVKDEDVQGKFKEMSDDECFDLVLGADVCYEPDHPKLLEAVLRRRLARGGRGVLCNAVRFPAYHADLMNRLGLLCSRVESQAVSSEEGLYAIDIVEEGTTQHSSAYPGGIQIITFTNYTKIISIT